MVSLNCTYMGNKVIQNVVAAQSSTSSSSVLASISSVESSPSSSSTSVNLDQNNGASVAESSNSSSSAQLATSPTDAHSSQATSACSSISNESCNRNRQQHHIYRRVSSKFSATDASTQTSERRVVDNESMTTPTANVPPPVQPTSPLRATLASISKKFEFFSLSPQSDSRRPLAATAQRLGMTNSLFLLSTIFNMKISKGLIRREVPQVVNSNESSAMDTSEDEEFELDSSSSSSDNETSSDESTTSTSSSSTEGDKEIESEEDVEINARSRSNEATSPKRYASPPSESWSRAQTATNSQSSIKSKSLVLDLTYQFFNSSILQRY